MALPVFWCLQWIFYPSLFCDEIFYLNYWHPWLLMSFICFQGGLALSKTCNSSESMLFRNLLGLYQLFNPSTKCQDVLQRSIGIKIPTWFTWFKQSGYVNRNGNYLFYIVLTFLYVVFIFHWIYFGFSYKNYRAIFM